MTAALLISAIALFIIQSVSMKFVKAENLSDKLLVNALFTFLAGILMSIYLIVNYQSFLLSLSTLLFGCLFGFLFAFTILFYNLAISSGPLSYTAFYFSASMLIPTATGILFFHEKISIYLIAAVLLFLSAFYFLNVPSKKTGDEGADSIDLKGNSRKRWLLFCSLTFIGNGLLSVVQKSHQYVSNGTQAQELMLIGFYFAAVCYLISYVLTKRTISKVCHTPFLLLKENRIPVCLLAVSSLGGNLILTYLSGKIPGSYLFPLVQGSIIIGITFISALFFKEKLSKRGRLGILLGVCAIVLIHL